MKTLEAFIDQAIMLYPDEMFDVVDSDSKFCYFSDSLLTMLNVKPEEIGKNISYDPSSVEKTRIINQQVIKNRKIYKFISIYKHANSDYYIMRVVKYPLIDGDTVIGIMSMMKIMKAIHLEPGQGLHFDQIVFDLTNEVLNSLDKLILFYASIGFTQSETYQSIVNLGKRFSLNGFKYHYNQLLIKTKADSIQQIICEDENLRNKKFIPKALIDFYSQPILL